MYTQLPKDVGWLDEELTEVSQKMEIYWVSKDNLPKGDTVGC